MLILELFVVGGAVPALRLKDFAFFIFKRTIIMIIKRPGKALVMVFIMSNIFQATHEGH